MLYLNRFGVSLQLRHGKR